MNYEHKRIKHMNYATFTPTVDGTMQWMYFRLGTFSTHGLHSPVTYIPTMMHLLSEIYGVLHNILQLKKTCTMTEKAWPCSCWLMLLKDGMDDPVDFILSLEGMVMLSYSHMSPRDPEHKTLLSCGATMQLREKDLALCSRLWKKKNQHTQTNSQIHCRLIEETNI